jgi:hypothetical protein
VLAAGTEHPALGGRVHRSLKHCIGRRRSRHRAEHEIITHPRRPDNRCVHVTATHSPLSEQGSHVPVAEESEQQMLRIDHRPTEHPRLILGEQDQIVRLIGERAQHRTDRPTATQTPKPGSRDAPALSPHRLRTRRFRFGWPPSWSRGREVGQAGRSRSRWFVKAGTGIDATDTVTGFCF